MNFQKIINEGLHSMMNDIRGMGDNNEPNQFPDPENPMYVLSLNGKEIVRAVNKQDLLQKISALK